MSEFEPKAEAPVYILLCHTHGILSESTNIDGFITQSLAHQARRPDCLVTVMSKEEYQTMKRWESWAEWKGP